MKKVVEVGYVKDQNGRKLIRVKFNDGVEWTPTLTEFSEIMISMGECIKENERYRVLKKEEK